MNTESYLEKNPIVAKFIKELTEFQHTYHKTHFKVLYDINPNQWDTVVEVGSKYIKITVNRSCWGFISRVDGMLGGFPIKKGDLLKAASRSAPAKHSRGNIVDGTARYSAYGPEYMR